LAICPSLRSEPVTVLACEESLREVESFLYFCQSVERVDKLLFRHLEPMLRLLRDIS
jgi:hypothetical protein